MSFTIFYNEKAPFKAIKTRRSKNRKTDIYPKGVKPWFLCKNDHIFNLFFFFGNIDEENIFFDILKEKNAFLGYKKKTRYSKSRKIDIFPKGLTNGFGPKMASFRNSFEAI